MSNIICGEEIISRIPNFEELTYEKRIEYINRELQKYSDK